MNCSKKITINGYLVKYYDIREPKPRPIQEDVYTLDKDGADTLAIMGLNVTNLIISRYERVGYHVVSVERIPQHRTFEVDLNQLWNEAAQPATAEHEEEAV